MLKKRLIGVVTVKDGWAVQSFGYRRYLPLGKPECLVNNLNRWGADEILVQAIDRSTSCKGPDFELLERLGKLGLETPLIYAGGIRTVEEGLRSIELGADRIAVDTLLHVDPDVIRGLAERLGAQALIASLPLSRSQGRLSWLDYRNGSSKPLTPEVLALIKHEVNRLANEAVPTSELEARKAGLLGQWSRGLETTAGLAAALARLAANGEPVQTLTQPFSAWSAVTPAEVQRYAQAHFSEAARRIAVAGDVAAFEAALKTIYPSLKVIQQGAATAAP